MDASSIVPASRCERRPGFGQSLREVRAEEQHGIVGREIMAIVVEHRQAVLVDLGVGRVDVDRIDLLLRDRLVGEAMIETARRGEGQVVRALQSGPSVGTSDELLRKAKPELRMCLEIGQSRDAFGARVIGAQRQRISVVEA